MSLTQQFGINTAYYTSQTAVGGTGAGTFLDGVRAGSKSIPASSTAVRSLRFWYNSQCLRGIQIELTDGTTDSHGGQDSKYSSTEVFYFADGEKVTSLNVWSCTYSGGRCGRIELTTNRDRSLTVNAPHDGDPYQPEIGSGILLGLFGRGDSNDIHCLGFALLRRVERARLIDVDYPDIQNLVIETKPKEIKTITYDNSQGTVEQQFTFSGSETAIEEETWSVTAGMEAGVETEVKAGFPILAEGKVKVSVTLSVSGTYQRSNTQISEESFQFPLVVPAGKHIQATATLYEGNINTKYTGTMEYTLDSGKTFTYVMNGTYTGIAASQANIEIELYD